VERWTGLAGYRGLKDPEVERHFNGTFLAFEAEGWGPNQELMTNLGLRYDVAYLGAAAAPDAIRARLDAGLPAFFYLWSPHALNARYSLNRIQLPEYTLARFNQGLSDYPAEALEKVASTQFAEFAPLVAKLYAKFEIDNVAQERILASIDVSKLSVMQAACDWMRDETNVPVWEAWLPVENATAAVGEAAGFDTNWLRRGHDCRSYHRRDGHRGS
jgi:ABC-type proline/glycine betaine transport system substrate-binding protein